MKTKPTKKQLLNLLGRIQLELTAHQMQDSKILAGYTLCANIQSLTPLSNETTNTLVKYAKF